MSEAVDQATTGRGGRDTELICPVCGERLVQEKCKVVCRSRLCGYRLIYNCSEF